MVLSSLLTSWVQYVPPLPAKKKSSTRVTGSRVLTSDEGYAILHEKEERKRKVKKRQEREDKKRQKDELFRKKAEERRQRRLLLNQGNQDTNNKIHQRLQQMLQPP